MCYIRRIWTFKQSEVFCKFSSRPSSHLQPFSMSQISIRPSKEVVARRPSLRKTQLEMPSQLLTSDFTSCSEPPQIILDFVKTDVQHEIFKICVFTCPTIIFCRIVVSVIKFKLFIYMCMCIKQTHWSAVFTHGCSSLSKWIFWSTWLHVCV